MGFLESVFGADADLLYDRQFAILLLGSISSPLGTAVVSPILASLTTPLGVDSARIGLLMAAYTAPAIFLIPVVGALSDRTGRKPVLAAGLTLFGLAGLAVPLTDSFTAILALRFLQGVGYTGIAPPLISAVGDLYTGSREAAAQGLRFTTVSVALAAIPPVAGALVAVAWWYPFLIYALALPTALVVAVFFREPERKTGAESASTRELLALAAEPRVFATLVGRATPTILWFAFVTYNSVVVVTLLDASPGAAGTILGVASVASAITGTQLGRLTAVVPRDRLLAGLITLFALGLSIFALAPSLLVAGVGAAFVGVGFGSVITLYRSEITGLSDTARGGLVSLGESLGRLASTGTPVVAGLAIAALQPGMGDGTAVRSVLLAIAALTVVLGFASVAVSSTTTDADPA